MNALQGKSLAQGKARLKQLSRSADGCLFSCPILDIRPDRISIWGHIPGSASLPVSSSLPLDKQLPAHMLPPKSQEFMVVDRDPKHARRVAESLVDRGYRACHLKEGLPSEMLHPGPPMGSLWSPEKFLMDNVSLLPRPGQGVLLDLGAGSGRNSVFMAMRGHHCLLVDRLPDALEMARDRAEHYQVEIRERVLDLRSPSAIEELGDADLSVIFCIRFFHEGLLRQIHEILPSGGVLVFWAYARGQGGAIEAGGGPRKDSFRCDLADFKEIFPDTRWEPLKSPAYASHLGARFLGAILRRN